MLNTIAWYERTIISLTIYLIKNIWGFSSLGYFKHNFSRHLATKYCINPAFHFYQINAGQLLDFMAITYSIFRSFHTVFQSGITITRIWCYHFFFFSYSFHVLIVIYISPLVKHLLRSFYFQIMWYFSLFCFYGCVLKVLYVF